MRARVVEGDGDCFVRPVGQSSRWTKDLLAFVARALFESEQARRLTHDDRQVLYGLTQATPVERSRLLRSLALDPVAEAACGPALPAGAVEHLRKERARIFVALPDGEPFCVELLLASARPIRRGAPKSKEGFSFSDVDDQLRRRALEAVFALERDWGSTMKPRRFLLELRAEYARLGLPLAPEVTGNDLNNELNWAVQKQLTNAKSYREREPGYYPSKLPEERPG